MAATYAAADINDPSVKHLVSIVDTIFNEFKDNQSNQTPKGNKDKKGKAIKNDNPGPSITASDNNVPYALLKSMLTKTFAEIVGYIQGTTNEKDEEIKVLHEEIKILKKHVVTGRLELEKSQQYQNRDVIKICGIKEPTGLGPREREDTNATLKNVFKEANITINDEDISVTHRLPSREATGKPKSLLFKASRRDFRNMVIRQKKSIRENTSFKNLYPDVFMVEHLTPMRSKVAYKLRHDENVDKTWTIDGRIKVVMKNAAPDSIPITIDSLSQLTKLDWTDKMIEDLVFKE